MWSKHWSITVVSCASGQSVTADRHTEYVFCCPLPHTPSPELPDYPRINNLSPNFISISLNRLGEEYTKERITQRLIENRDNIDFEPFQPKTYRTKQYRLRTRSDRIGKVGGLYGLYLYYCYRLGYLPKYKARQQNQARVHYLFKGDLMKIDELTKQVTLLGKHHIGTDEQLFSYQHSVEEQVKTLTADRTHLRNEIRKVNITDAELSQAKASISLLTEKLKELRKEVKLCQDIAIRSKVIEEKLFFDYMLSHPKDTHWYPVFYVMANTGMRVGEITGLRWSDIDLKKGIIRVNHTLVYYNHRDEKGCYFSINTPKTKAGEREIPMTEGVKQAFLMEREFQSQAEISSKSRVDGYDDFIFVNRYGDVQNQGNLNKALRRMMRDCNDEILEKYGADSDPVLLPQFSCHILRHTFATRLCESGANLKFIQSILGHADVSTTMNIYVDVTDALKKKEITAFDDYMTTKLET